VSDSHLEGRRLRSRGRLSPYFLPYFSTNYFKTSIKVRDPPTPHEAFDEKKKKRKELQNRILPFGSQFSYSSTASTGTCIGHRLRYVFWEDPNRDPSLSRLKLIQAKAITAQIITSSPDMIIFLLHWMHYSCNSVVT
jgi:hypothetical protein